MLNLYQINTMEDAGVRTVRVGDDYAVEVASWLLRSAWQTPASCAVLEED